ncbi:hypothetical protein CVD25_13550 [Bacillus canaveralius]|uniref:Uncharacterized protein n=2 Tax=Bacillus canaveralius TaxID=1403243 RepID=A0A2N5GQ25_9BACI|nr:hypothetical protein [Bacillus canaveralius]PLR84908.1 hypothetical protein CU635_05305 [Bacillus canaveralius]PLR95810.1 hypothetical protein CVD25_13550 [Bacillus canaveralius]
MKLKFVPIKFQAALAAGSVALMAFNYLQFAIPHGEGLIKISDIVWSQLSLLHSSLYALLVFIMLASSIANLILTAVFLMGLTQWLGTKNQFTALMDNPLTNITIFVPIASLSMTANVVWGPLAFYIPGLSIQTMMLPSLIYFGVLWTSLFFLEFKVAKSWFTKPVDISKLNFVWLLDVFAFGLVSLTGTGIASMAENSTIVSLASVSSLFVLSIGVFLFIAKLSFLIYMQIKNAQLPDKPILPAFFLVIPITCLLGLSFYRIMTHLQNVFSFDISVISFYFITVSYVITIGWGIFTVYLLVDYLRKDFYKSQFSPTQWGMV